MILIETDRLLIGKWDINDIDEYLPIYQNKQNLHYMPFPDGLSREGMQSFIQNRISHDEKHHFTIWPLRLKETNEFIGHCGLQYIPDEYVEVELAYLLSNQYWKQGLITEAGRAVIHYAFHTLRLSHLVAVTYPENIASQNVLKRLGFNDLGMSTKYYNGVNACHFELQNLDLKRQ